MAGINGLESDQCGDGDEGDDSETQPPSHPAQKKRKMTEAEGNEKSEEGEENEDLTTVSEDFGSYLDFDDTTGIFEETGTQSPASPVISENWSILATGDSSSSNESVTEDDCLYEEISSEDFRRSEASSMNVSSLDNWNSASVFTINSSSSPSYHEDSEISDWDEGDIGNNWGFEEDFGEEILRTELEIRRQEVMDLSHDVIHMVPLVTRARQQAELPLEEPDEPEAMSHMNLNRIEDTLEEIMGRRLSYPVNKSRLDHRSSSIDFSEI